MVESTNSNFEDVSKPFRVVTTPSSASMLNSNLSCRSGTHLALAKNTLNGGQISIYGPQVVQAKEDNVEAVHKHIYHKSDIMFARFLTIDSLEILVICHMTSVLGFN